MIQIYLRTEAKIEIDVLTENCSGKDQDYFSPKKVNQI